MTIRCRTVLVSLAILFFAAQIEVKAMNALMEFSKTAILGCDVEGQTKYIGKPVTWYRNGEIIKIDNVKYDTNEDNNTLVIHKATEKDIGMYVCGFLLENVDNHTQQVYLNAKPHVKEFEPKSKNLVQGDPLVLNCKVWAYPHATVMWYREDSPIDPSKDKRITQKDWEGSINSSLRIEDLEFDDRANYVCVATNEFGTYNSTIMVRVKDKYAALWPFLGICAEVVVLCVIIFIYERRRAKKLEEEDTPEEAGHLTNSNDNSVRHRK